MSSWNSDMGNKILSCKIIIIDNCKNRFYKSCKKWFIFKETDSKLHWIKLK